MTSPRRKKIKWERWLRRKFWLSAEGGKFAVDLAICMKDLEPWILSKNVYGGDYVTNSRIAIDTDSTLTFTESKDD